MAPCTRCEKKGLECRTLPESKRCGGCVYAGVTKCDVSGLSPSDWDILTREEARLEAEEEAAALAEQEDFRRRMEIRMKQKSLRDRGSEMLRRRVSSLDELDTLEERERLEKERVEREAAKAQSTASGSSRPNPPLFNPLMGLSEAGLAEVRVPSDEEVAAFWAGLGMPGGMPSTSQGN